MDEVDDETPNPQTARSILTRVAAGFSIDKDFRFDCVRVTLINMANEDGPSHSMELNFIDPNDRYTVLNADKIIDVSLVISEVQNG